MSLRNSIDEYVGPSGGFSVPAGTYQGQAQEIILYGDGGIVLRTDAVTQNGSLSGIATENIFLSSSGTIKLHCENGNMDITASGNITFGAINNLQAGTFGGAFIVDIDGNYLGLWGGTYQNFSTQIVMNTLSGGDAIYSATGNTTLKATFNATIDALKGQITLDAWASSGQMRYEFGPNEAWHVSPSHTSDFFPIAHSGQVVQMIEEAVPTIVGTSGVGATDGTVSGINQYCSLANVVGTSDVINASLVPIPNPFLVTMPAMDVIIRRDPIFQGLNPITVLRTGFYKAGYTYNMENSANASRTIAEIRLYNTTTDFEPSGTRTIAYLRLDGAGEGTASLSPVLVYAEAGDILATQVRKIAGTGNVDLLPNSHITLEFIGDWNQ